MTVFLPAVAIIVVPKPPLLYYMTRQIRSIFITNRFLAYNNVSINFNEIYTTRDFWTVDATGGFWPRPEFSQFFSFLVPGSSFSSELLLGRLVQREGAGETD